MASIYNTPRQHTNLVPVTGSRRGERGDDRMRIAEQDAQDQDGGGGWPAAGAGGRRHVTPPARVAASPAVFHRISQGNEPPLCFPRVAGHARERGHGARVRTVGGWESEGSPPHRRASLV